MKRPHIYIFIILAYEYAKYLCLSQSTYHSNIIIKYIIYEGSKKNKMKKDKADDVDALPVLRSPLLERLCDQIKPMKVCAYRCI